MSDLSQAPLYLAEFPNFDDRATCEALIAAGAVDQSWHNDSAPSFKLGAATISVDYLDAELSEHSAMMGEGYAQSRFCVYDDDSNDTRADCDAATLADALAMAAVINALHIAAEFNSRLCVELTSDEFCEVRERNATSAYGDGVCASHDFCDANMIMAPAFAHVMGREIVLSDDSDVALWNAAWTIAKRDYLTAV